MKNIIACTLIMASTAFASDPSSKNMAKVKKSEQTPIKQKRILRKIGSDDGYDYYEVTPAELKIIEAARKAFAEAQNLQPPPYSLQKKMQDQVGGSNEDERR